MFSIFNSRKAVPVGDDERKEIMRLLEMAEDTRHGAFLHLMDKSKLKFRWNPAMDVKNGVLGNFGMLRPNTIDLAPGPSPHSEGDYPFDRILSLMPTIWHELDHKFQLNEAPLSFLLDGLPLVREAPWSTEPDARAVEEAMEEFYSARRRDIEMSWRNGA